MDSGGKTTLLGGGKKDEGAFTDFLRIVSPRCAGSGKYYGLKFPGLTPGATVLRRAARATARRQFAFFEMGK